MSYYGDSDDCGSAAADDSYYYTGDGESVDDGDASRSTAGQIMDSARTRLSAVLMGSHRNDESVGDDNDGDSTSHYEFYSDDNGDEEFNEDNDDDDIQNSVYEPREFDDCESDENSCHEMDREIDIDREIIEQIGIFDAEEILERYGIVVDDQTEVSNDTNSMLGRQHAMNRIHAVRDYGPEYYHDGYYEGYGYGYNERCQNCADAFFMNVHRGKYDAIIDNTCAQECMARDMNSVRDQFRPDGWEERKARALSNLKHDLQLCSNKIRSFADVGILKHLQIRSNSSVSEQHPDGRIEDEPVVSHEESLQSYWNELSKALAERKSINLCHFEVTNIQLPDEVMEDLASNLTGKIHFSISFENANMTGDGIKSFAKLIRTNPDVRSLLFNHNRMNKDIDAGLCLAKALAAHPSIQILEVENCGIGDTVDLLSAILESGIKNVYLGGNDISTKGAMVISKYLETNPPIQRLGLNDNRFHDTDALLFGQAMKKNNMLRGLDLMRNDFTAVGIKHLLKGLFDSTSLNTIFESNPSCMLTLFPSDGSLYWVQDILGHIKVDFDRKRKLLVALHEHDSLLRYLSDVPAELMPDVLVFIQTEKNRFKRVNMMYVTMRWWNMPLLYSFSGDNRNALQKKRKRDYVEHGFHEEYGLNVSKK